MRTKCDDLRFMTKSAQRHTDDRQTHGRNLLGVGNALNTTTIRLQFDGRSTVVSLRFDNCRPTAQRPMRVVATAADNNFVRPSVRYAPAGPPTRRGH